MRVLIDTNVLISAILNPQGTSWLAYCRAAAFPNRGLICQQNIEELHKVFSRKFPNRSHRLELFLSVAIPTLECIDIPKNINPSELEIRDPQDRPLLRAAIAANADLILTGDKDFKELKLKKPRVVTPTEFLEM